LFLIGIPLVLYALDRSLASSDAFASMKTLFGSPLAKVVLIGLAWAYLYHFCAGIRFLLLDVHIGDDLRPTRQSSVAVIVASLALTLIVAVRLW